jgi:hypothetical protein
MINVPRMLWCFSGELSGTEKIILAQFIALGIAYWVFSLNKKKEKDFLRDRIKIEIGGICDRIMRHTGAAEVSRLQHYFNSRLATWGIGDRKEALLKQSENFLIRANDSSIDAFLTKAELIEKMSYLFLYINDKKLEEKLKNLTLEIHNIQISEDMELIKSYIESKSILELNAIHKEKTAALNNPPEDTRLQNLCIEVQVLLNPKFYERTNKQNKRETPATTNTSDQNMSV